MRFEVQKSERHVSSPLSGLSWRSFAGVGNPMQEEQFDKTVEAAIAAICRRRMVLPAVLLLAGHRPLAFTFGQVLLILQPLAALLGNDGLDSWARLLSHPRGPAALTERLAESLVEDTPATRDLRSGS